MDPARIAVPTPVQKPAPHGFPLMATIAPVAMSVVIWLVTKSAFALMFAGLGPAVAIASVADARRQSKRRVRSERSRFDNELSLAREDVVAFHGRERAELDLDFPSATARLSRGDHDPERWRATIDTCQLTVGRASGDSRVDLDVPPSRDEQAGPLLELAAFARVLDDVPLPITARLGVAIVGPRALAGAVARGMIVQLAALLGPHGNALAVDALPPDGHWLHELPHRLLVDSSLGAGEVAFVEIDSTKAKQRCVVAVAASVDRVASDVHVVIRAGEDARILRHPDRSRCGPVVLEYVAREQARGWARRLAGLAGSMAQQAVPDAVAFADIEAIGGTDAGTLSATIGMTATGPCTVDLVNDGPHAVVGGITGSGKSELLIAWVLGLAAAYPPTAVTFLLVDFKGGSSFAPLEGLSHCVGLISDLDERSAIRALESLKAEVRLRERMLSEARARSIDELPQGCLPRLVIVVDEFAAMVADYPDLHALFADLAARGRSLGLHLVLCTQRPAGAVRDSVLANAGLRISLRVNNRADSRAVIDSDAAADLPAQPRGRALVSVAGEPPRELQVALAESTDAAAVAARWAGFAAPRRPWRDPLPAVVPVADLDRPGPSDDADGIPFALADHPEQQSQPTLAWSPRAHGHLLVVGAARSGKSNVLAVLAQAPGAERLSTDPELAWDRLVDVLVGIRAAHAGLVLLIDDLDSIVARYSDEHATAFVETLAAVLREGPARGVRVAIATQRITPGLHAIVSLCDRRLLLRMPSRQDHIIAGGASELYADAAPPGRGTWGTHVIQVARAGEATSSTPRPELSGLEPPFAVVSTAPGVFAERARSRGATVVDIGDDLEGRLAGLAAPIIVGDVDSWQSRWGSLQAANSTMPVLFEGCSLAEFRVLTRSRSLPPPLVTSAGAGWVLSPGGAVRRGHYAGGVEAVDSAPK